MREMIQEVARLIARAQNVMALTGAGISVESGIPDFRSEDGLWTIYDPAEYATINAFRRDPFKVWQMLAAMDELIARAEPNPAHMALARMERAGRLNMIVTQNVDGLHQAAGSKNVVEFHGSGNHFTCQSCGAAAARKDLNLRDLPPLCVCGGVYKPDVILFGEPIPEDAVRASLAMSSICQVMLVIGTSAMVAPASHLPLLAKQGGAKVVEINLEPTGLTDEISDFTFRGSASNVLVKLTAAVEEIASSN